jgi:hypothetical protein
MVLKLVITSNLCDDTPECVEYDAFKCWINPKSSSFTRQKLMESRDSSHCSGILDLIRGTEKQLYLDEVPILTVLGILEDLGHNKHIDKIFMSNSESIYQPEVDLFAFKSGFAKISGTEYRRSALPSYTFEISRYSYRFIDQRITKSLNSEYFDDRVLEA